MVALQGRSFILKCDIIVLLQTLCYVYTSYKNILDSVRTFATTHKEIMSKHKHLLKRLTSLYGENTTIGRLGFTKSSRWQTIGVGYIFVATINLTASHVTQQLTVSNKVTGSKLFLPASNHLLPLELFAYYCSPNKIIGILSLCTSAHLTVLPLFNPPLNLSFSLLPITSSHPHASASDSTFESIFD